MTVRIGITGAFGTGKTTVLGFFGELGAATWNADEAVHKELSSNKELCGKIRKVFGDEVFFGNRIDKKELAKKAFGRPRGVEKLNALVHPLVKKRLFEFFKKNRSKVVVAEVPLLFEAGFDRYFDLTVCVFSKRSRRKGAFTPEEISRRMRHQMPLDKKMALCDITIDNNWSRKNTFEQVKTIMEEEKWKSLRSRN